MPLASSEKKRYQPCHGPAADTSYVERRKDPRYLITRPVLVVPVLADLSPDWERHAEGLSVDLSEGGIKFEIPAGVRLGSKRVLVGVETDTEEMHFATAEVCHRRTEGNLTAMGAQFNEGERDWIRDDNLMPTLSSGDFRYSTKLPPDVLAKWCHVGIMRPMLFDWLLACPECQGLPTFRMGCPNCGSSRLGRAQLIHHFACAHVGFVPDFEQGGEIVCPKCRTQRLVVGTDFEYLGGPHRCIDCNWSGTELVQVAQCVACGLRFPSHEAHEMELIGYHVERLDPLAFLGSA